MRRTEQITDKTAAARGHLQGRLRVAAAPSAVQLLPALIGELIRDHPDVDVVLLEGSDSEVCAWLEDRVADLAVTAPARERASRDGRHRPTPRRPVRRP